MTDLLLKRSGSTGNQYEVLAEDQVVGHIRLSNASPTTPWLWTLAYGQPEDRTPTNGYYEPTREAAMQAFARSWNREQIAE